MEVLSRKITYKEFAKMDFPEDDPFLYELINGELVRKNAPSGEHQFAQSKLFLSLSRFVDDKEMGMVFSSPSTSTIWLRASARRIMYAVPPSVIPIINRNTQRAIGCR